MAQKPPYRGDPNGRHARLYATVLNSPAWRVLGYASKALYVDLREKLGSTNNGNISAALSNLKHKGWRHPGTLAKALRELQALGFIVKTRGGGVEFGSRVCALYAFTDQDIFAHPKLGVESRRATHDYAQFKTLQEAEAALRNGVQQLQAQALERKRKMIDREKATLRNMDRTDMEIVAMEDADRSKKRSNEGLADTDFGAAKSPAKSPKTRMASSFIARSGKISR